MVDTLAVTAAMLAPPMADPFHDLVDRLPVVDLAPCTLSP
jgi:hypothetical protein